jgi:signal transduction histidine kinase
MKFRRRLRFRIIISFLIFGTLLSGLFAVTALGMRQYLENALIDETIVGDLSAHLNSVLAGRGSNEGFSSRYVVWLGVPEKSTELAVAMPPDQELRDRAVEVIALPDGLHSLKTSDHEYRIAVDKRRVLWGYVFYDATPDERENVLLFGFLASAFVVISILAFAMAVWSSKRVMSPVSDLARRISGMGADVHPDPLAPNYADDEVGQLARALDEYADRLTALVMRDQEFNADVSHELRTPLAVIKSATELLMAQPDLNEKTKVRLERIKRASRQSTELTEALLHLVRAERTDRTTGEYFRVDKIVEEVIDFKKSQVGTKPVEINLDVQDSFLVCAPAAVIAVALGNLIGNAIKYTPKGTVDIAVGGGRVIVEDSGPGLQEGELQKVFTRHYRGQASTGKGSGLGLAIVRRFCEMYEWRIDIAQREQGGLRATLCFEHES